MDELINRDLLSLTQPSILAAVDFMKHTGTPDDIFISTSTKRFHRPISYLLQSNVDLSNENVSCTLHYPKGVKVEIDSGGLICMNKKRNNSCSSIKFHPWCMSDAVRHFITEFGPDSCCHCACSDNLCCHCNVAKEDEYSDNASI